MSGVQFIFYSFLAVSFLSLFSFMSSKNNNGEERGGVLASLFLFGCTMTFGNIFL
jgi:hypothetical protein